LESEIEHFKHELAITQAELKSHLSIKRSTVLTLGNIKRRIARGSVKH
ncbi:MAG: hypothetical protein JWN33_1, partial [Candidatus Saccharibacteria bacterium]|nr:hypothetical protein [Candidatus Saccharibacteria bacterium]